MKRKGPSNIVLVFGLLFGCVVFGGLAAGGFGWWVTSMPEPSPEAHERFDVSQIPVPPFPERNEPIQEDGVRIFELAFGGDSKVPGHGQTIWLYLPAGQADVGSLPCVLIAPAGSNGLGGMRLAGGDRGEHIPYVKAGMAVVAYALDGAADDEADPDDVEAFREPYQAFRASGAGVVNARNALAFVRKRVPEVDAKRIYFAGHSSAGGHALLVAAHLPGLAGVLAYAPGLGVAFDDVAAYEIRALNLVLRGVYDFATKSSPRTHVGRIKGPAFFFGPRTTT